jgi:sodium transport system permease protein
MRLKNVGIIFRKEVTDIVRDRRTLGFMVLLPILVIPGLMWVLGKVADSGKKRLQENTSILAIVGGDQTPSMVRLLEGLGNAADPGFLTELDDPLLADGLMHLMSPEEAADAFMAMSSIDPEKLEGARFLSVVDFEPATAAGKELFAGGPPEFLADAARLRLLSSAQALERMDEAAQEELADPALIADRQRLRNLSEAERAALDEQLADFDAMRRELAAGLEAGAFHAVLVFHDGFGDALHGDGTARYSVLYDEPQEKSSIARRKVIGFLDRLSEGLVRSRIVDHGLSATVLDPLSSEAVNVGRERNMLALFLPYVVILMCFAGAIYPAIDLGAGEKERGTLETLLVTPADRIELVLGKFLVITLGALTAAMLNIASLTVTMKLGLLAEAAVSGLELDPKAIILSAVLMLPVAALFASVLLALSIFAKTFKEAQSYTAPINMAIIVPAFFSMIPGIELTIPLALVPLVNVSLALKEAWAGIFQWDCLAVLVVSSAVYAAAALVFCVKWFQREEVLFRT